jgi:hypothetical protein
MHTLRGLIVIISSALLIGAGMGVAVAAPGDPCAPGRTLVGLFCLPDPNAAPAPVPAPESPAPQPAPARPAPPVHRAVPRPAPVAPAPPPPAAPAPPQSTTPECPAGSVTVGLLCHEPSPSGLPTADQERLALVRLCLQIRAGQIIGAQTGGPITTPDNSAVKAELVCDITKPLPPVVVVPPPAETVPAPTPASPAQPPTAEQNLQNNPQPVEVTH